MTPEGKIEKYFIKRVKETGGEQRKLKWIGRNGAPDRLAWWPPKLSVECRSSENVIPGDIVPVFAFVELKRPKKGAEDRIRLLDQEADYFNKQQRDMTEAQRLEAATKTSVTTNGTVKYEVVGVDVEKLT